VPTYAELQTQIALELGRTDLTTPIQTAILAAIRHYQRRLSLFGQSTQSISTVAGTAEYSLATDFLALDFVQLANASGTVSLEPEVYEVLAALDHTGLRSEPDRYAYRNYKIRLYPVPDAVYTVTAYYWAALAAPTGAGDSTGWTNDLLDLIRHRAKVDLAANVLRDDQGAAIYRAAEGDTLDGIILQRDRALSVGRVVPTEF
jgi:hypothetical protein